MSKTLYERVGYKALKLFSLDQIEQWLVFLRHDKQMREDKGQKEPGDMIDELMTDFMEAEQELTNGI